MKRSFLLAVLLSVPGPAAVMAQLFEPTAGCVDEPTEEEFPRYARLMHDFQWMPWPSRMADPEWNRGFHSDWYPATVQLSPKPNGGVDRVPYSREWLEYLRELQPDDETAVWIARVAAGLFNRGNDFIPILELGRLKTKPVAQTISSAGNVVRVLEAGSRSARVEMLYFKSDPPDPAEINFEKTPWLVTKFTSISIDGRIGNAGGIEVYFPNLGKAADGYWVDTQRIELFPPVPLCATVKTPLNVREAPSTAAPVIGGLDPGQAVMIREYLPQGGNVWGLTDYGWIALEYQFHGRPAYFTSWTMETQPAMVFD